jgi:uncharacterized membrane protein
MPFAIPALGAVIPAAMALLVILGAVVLLHVLARALDNLLGKNWFAAGLAHVGDAVSRALSSIGDWLDSMLYDLSRALESVPRALDEAMGWIAWSLRSKAEWLRSVIYTWIPNLWDSLTKNVQGIYTWATSWVSGLIDGVYNWTRAVVDGVKAWVSGLVNDIYAWARQAFDSVYRWAIGQLNAVYGWVMSLADGIKAWVSGLVNDIYAWATRELTGLRAWITLAISAAVSQVFNAAVDWSRRFTEQAVGTLENALAIAAALPLVPAWPRIQDAIDAIARALPGSLAATLPKIGAIPRAIPRDLAGILAAIGALAAVGVDWIKECGVPMCRKLGGFGNEIEALEDGLMILDLLDILSDIIHDPRGSASDAATAFSSLVSEAADGIIDAVAA